ncbi:hypothetical protein [Saccharomonospora viridis]|uniref:Excreted virulence factor EspC, type VII ESX diderm n=2 Tax=Saccharomonospora viridis TaxID=1852 RepID=C7MTJ7_SACVD|nr:hypothetical protein [Saccharomonospora viridis]ACU95467.1 hypothetical protein Svir_03900 [Saccharomonospora viridis DSM 43017]KHF45099.1 hypothetical protein MINT15_19810 [Saccharomonospora viridis]SFP13466.1 hypothetical protein SAMN02982918_1346 [Saccharomonospora viridis]
MSKFFINPEVLEKYSQKLAEHKSSVNHVRDLVAQADVSDESWGIVGLFVKQSYTEMLGDFKDLLKDMSDGLDSASDKMMSATRAYREIEEENRRILVEITRRINAAKIKNITS